MGRVVLLPLHRFIMGGWGSEYEWAINIARASCRLGVPVHAVCGELDAEARSVLGSAGISLTELGVGGQIDPISDVKFYARLWRAGARIVGPTDIVHHVFPFGIAQGFNPTILRKATRRVVLGPVLFPNLDVAADKQMYKSMGKPGSEGVREAYPGILLRFLNARTICNADLLIFDCEATRKIYSELIPAVLQIPHLFMPGGVDSATFGMQRSAASSGAPFRVGVSTYLRPRKRIDTLIRALPLVRDRSVVLRIGGAGPGREQLEKLAKELGVEDRVEFAGYVPRVTFPSFFAQLGAYALLDRPPYDTLPSIQEAMMSGLPVIAADRSITSGIRELPHGFLVRSDSDSQGVAEAMARLASDASLATKMGGLARRYAEEHFSIESNSEVLRKAYELDRRDVRDAPA